VYCGQTVGRIKVELGVQRGLGPGHIVLDGDPAPPPQRGTAPHFWPISVAAKWMHGSTCHLVWMELGLDPGDFLLDGDPAATPKRGRSPPIFGPCLLWPNGWMDQDGTWHGGRPQPRRLCVKWYPATPVKGGGAPSPISGPFLLWPYGWMHEDATWYGCRPQPRGLCVRWGPSPPYPKRGHCPRSKFLAHVYCGQTAGWIKMPLGTKVGLSPGDFALDGDQAPNFRPMSIVAKWLDGSR